MRTTIALVLALGCLAGAWYWLAQAKDVVAPQTVAPQSTLTQPAEESVESGVERTPLTQSTSRPAPTPSESFLGNFVTISPVENGLTIQVLHPDTRAPIRGAVVRAVMGGNRNPFDRSGPPQPAYLTDIDGHAQLALSTEPTYVDIRAMDSAGPMQFLGAVGHYLGVQNTVVLARIRFIDVTVVTKDGQPMAGVPVHSFMRSWRWDGPRDNTIETLKTDLSGHVQIPYRIDADTPSMGRGIFDLGEFMVGIDGMPLLAAKPQFGPDGHASVQLVCPGIGQLQIVVQTPSGQTLQSGRIYVKDADTGEEFGGRNSIGLLGADSSGKYGFQLSGLPLGRSFKIAYSVFPRNEAIRTTSTVAGPTEPNQLVLAELTTGSEAWLLKGRLVDGANQPLANLELQVGIAKHRVHTDAAGRFQVQLTSVPNLAVLIKHDFENSEPARLMAALPQHDQAQLTQTLDIGVVVMHRPRLVASGFLRDNLGNPIMGQVFAVGQFIGLDGKAVVRSRGSLAAPSNAAGFFEIWAPVDAPSISLVARSPLGDNEVGLPVSFGATDVEIVIKPMATVSLQVASLPAWANGKLAVKLRSLEGPDQYGSVYEREWRLGPDTQYGPIPPGHYEVHITTPQAGNHLPPTWSIPVQLAAGVNDLGPIDTTLDLRTYTVEFIQPPGEPVKMPHMLYPSIPNEEYGSKIVGAGEQFSPTSWRFICVGPAESVFGDHRTWQLTGKHTRIFL